MIIEKQMKQDFFMLRHGETTNNKKKTATGWLDAPLTDLGVDQAMQCAEIVETTGIKPSVVVHTGLQRSFATAEIINRELNCSLVECSALKEQYFGDWEGVEWSKIYPLIEEVGVNPPNGEKQEDFILRISSGFTRILEKYSAPILFVTHGGVFEALGQHYGCIIKNIENCTLHSFEYKIDSQFPYDVHAYRMEENKVIKKTMSYFWV